MSIWKLESDSKLFVSIMQIVNRYAAKSEKLIGYYTLSTNLAAMWMSIQSRFDGGNTEIKLEHQML